MNSNSTFLRRNQDLFENWLVSSRRRWNAKVSTIENPLMNRKSLSFSASITSLSTHRMDQMIYPQNPPLQTLKRKTVSRQNVTLRKDIEQIQQILSILQIWQKHCGIWWFRTDQNQQILAVSETGIDELDVKNIPEARMYHYTHASEGHSHFDRWKRTAWGLSRTAMLSQMMSGKLDACRVPREHDILPSE